MQQIEQILGIDSLDQLTLPPWGYTIQIKTDQYLITLKAKGIGLNSTKLWEYIMYVEWINSFNCVESQTKTFLDFTDMKRSLWGLLEGN